MTPKKPGNHKEKVVVTYPNKAVMELHPNEFSTQGWITSGSVLDNLFYDLLSSWTTSFVKLIAQLTSITNIDDSEQSKRNKEDENTITSPHFHQ